MDSFSFIQLVSIIVIACGVLMQLVKRNRICGARTTGTLSDQTVWGTTTRMAGRIALVTGITLFVLNLLARDHRWALWFDVVAEVVLTIGVALLVAAVAIPVLSTTCGGGSRKG